MTDSVKPREVKCPKCGLLTLYSTDNPFRPFCSDRCRTNDLGAWADETYRVPVSPSSSDSLSIDDDYDDDPSENKH